MSDNGQNLAVPNRTPIMLSLVSFLVPVAIIALGQGIATLNPISIGVGVIIMAFDAYIILAKFVYHRLVKYASLDTYAIYRYWRYGGRGLLIAAANAVIERIGAKETVKLLDEHLTPTEKAFAIMIGYGWFTITYENDGGGQVILGAPLPPESLSPRIPRGYAPLDGYDARTGLRDITGVQIGRIIEGEIVLPATRGYKLKQRLRFAHVSDKRVITKDIPIIMAKYYDLRAMWDLAALQGVRDPQFKSLKELQEVTQGVGEAIVKFNMRAPNEELAIASAATEKALSLVDTALESEAAISPTELLPPGVPPEEGPKKHFPILKVTAVILAILIASAATITLAPIAIGYYQHAQPPSPTKLPAGWYYVYFYQTGLANGTHWVTALDGHNATATTNYYQVFAVQNGVFQFKVYPPQGYLARPPAGQLVINGTGVSQIVEFVRA